MFKLYLKGTTWSPEKDTLQCAIFSLQLDTSCPFRYYCLSQILLLKLLTS
ncbi:hypothetical protein VTO73DRAFT_15081 [Trametes versicolor]